MKFFDKLGKLEQGIGRTVGFSKGFGTFEKADVANRVRIMMDDESYVDGSGRTMAPNIYTLRFAPVDFPRVREWGNPFAVELCDLAISHARAQGYTLIGAVRVTFNVLDSLAEGEFEVVANFEPFSVPGPPPPPPPAGRRKLRAGAPAPGVFAAHAHHETRRPASARAAGSAAATGGAAELSSLAHPA
mgnify:CR=1 FL=1